MFKKPRAASEKTGVRGETSAYWYLRRLGYIFVARNFPPSHAKGELDLVGYDGEALTIVELRTRLYEPDKPAQPEMSVGKEKHELLVRTAHYFLRERISRLVRCDLMSWRLTRCLDTHRRCGCIKPHCLRSRVGDLA